MYTINVNGKDYTTTEDKKLLSFLRDDLRFTSVKDGCSEGACGTCTVLVDGKKFKACVQKVSKFEGKKIITVEGLTEREKSVYEHCFAEAGAVQCGFCIPGMVIAAKSLLDINNNPSLDEVKKAIRGNICRCTGYKKIEEAILMAAKFFRENLEIPEEPKELHMNQRYKRPDVAEKVNGTGKFVDDLYLPGMIYAKAVRSKYPRAMVNKIDISKALEHQDCVRILLKKDVPDNVIGHMKKDWDVMIGEGEITRYVGDCIALVATNHKETLDEVCSLVEVDYTELTPITSPQDALRGDAPLIHKDGNIMARASLVRGNADEAIKNSKYVVTRKYKTPHQEHGFMEPECAIAAPEGDDGILLYSGGQSVYDEQREIAMMLKIPKEKVHCHTQLVGGGFGGKEDMSVQHLAALMAWHTKKPVKVKFSRQESLAYHTKRHPMEIEFTTACDENGILTGMKAVIIADTGAYASLGGPVLQRACTHAAGPYNYQNVDILGMSVYTNNMVSGAFRGFGAAQSCFAMENNLNILAEEVGISPWEIRYRNAIRPGQILPNGQIADESVGLVECLEAVKDIYESNPYAGIAVGWKNSGKGVGIIDSGRCKLLIKDGKVHVLTSAACMGQGIAIMCKTMLCEATGLEPQIVIHESADTIKTPDSGTSTASRQTVVTGEAVKRASMKLKEDLDKGLTLNELEGKEYFGEYHPMTDGLTSTKEFPVRHVSYSYGVQVVILNEKGKVEKVVAAYDVGTPVNIQAVEGQIEGGMVMGLGYALTEEFKCEDGYCKTKLGTLGLMRSTETPELEVKLVKGPGEIPLSFGAKGCGELCMIPTGAACSHAYYRLDGKLRTSMPLRETYYKK
ncbi:selenium-dependent xanthine dehydrogenase [Clostridium sp. NSJ-145]|uniref:selenium-dependent xanthine dehydrogenase n=1 Tax=Clostridium sp. NSJ-145 TaxID=2897777 RepID=UPI001E38A54C|nr:selenium-dependent xanthine dehydrogenase [Clostridium sp. NSJ-145]MCD2500447.1 selenium-dependent xanthine dehydrogenase [Clostridium sp. NSJ-145]